LPDIFSPRKRSEIMSHIKPKNSKQEIFIRKIINSLGYRYRLHQKDLIGKPDMVFPKLKKAIFVNGCFWHGHKRCKRASLPTTNRIFWKKKINGNIERDKLNYRKLRKQGWKYLIIWQCKIKEKNKKLLKNKISAFLQNSPSL
jgi:DNA mismatch endonuclease, patch repair protein